MTINRWQKWRVAASCMGVMAILGTIYSWSLFTQPLSACFGWTQMESTASFAVAIFFLGLGTCVGGRLQKSMGSRQAAAAGILMWGAGNVLAGAGLQAFGAPWMALFYGAIGGFGVGMGYVSCIACVSRWFHDHPGAGTGMVTMGFAVGSLGYDYAVKSVPAFAQMASAAEAAGAIHQTLGSAAGSPLGWTLAVSGCVFMVLGLLCVLGIKDRVIEVDEEREEEIRTSSYTTREMLGTRSFYVLWTMLFLNIIVGIELIGNALPIMRDLTSSDPTSLAEAWGALALANVAGRFAWGAMADWIGSRASFALIYVTQAVALFFLGSSEVHDLVGVCALISVVMLGYGGGFGLMPTFCARYFGLGHVGPNYGAMLTAWGCAGAIGPMLGAAIKDGTGGYQAAMPILSGIMVFAALLPLIAIKPKSKLVAPIVPVMDEQVQESSGLDPQSEEALGDAVPVAEAAA